MRANPGGHIPAVEVVGREALVQRLWRILERQSVVLTAERRMGKTCVIKKMVEQAPVDHLAVYRDLEGLRSPLEFVETLFHDVERHLSARRRTAERVRGLLSDLQGAEVGKVVKFPPAAAPHWKTLLQRTVEDLADNQQGGVFFFWDEVPLMVYNISQTNGEPTAMELLDALRAMRQTHPTFRMVYTGSIGLHNVLRTLKRSGYANDPTNDMLIVDVPPLSPTDATHLARALLQGEGLLTRVAEDVPEAIAHAVDGIPYFIHHVVDHLAATTSGDPITTEHVQTLVGTCLTDPQDRWDLAHYRQRLDTYYLPEELPIALSILDALAASRESLSLRALLDRTKSQIALDDSERFASVVTSLQRDHYLLQEAAGTLRFRFPLIQTFWRTHRGLPR
jgi:hypothetical protein